MIWYSMEGQKILLPINGIYSHPSLLHLQPSLAIPERTFLLTKYAHKHNLYVFLYSFTLITMHGMNMYDCTWTPHASNNKLQMWGCDTTNIVMARQCNGLPNTKSCLDVAEVNQSTIRTTAIGVEPAKE